MLPEEMGREGPCAVMLPRGGFVGHHIWVSSDADGLESHPLAGEILPPYVSICRVPFSSCGAVVPSHSHHLAYPSSCPVVLSLWGFSLGILCTEMEMGTISCLS